MNRKYTELKSTQWLQKEVAGTASAKAKVAASKRLFRPESIGVTRWLIPLIGCLGIGILVLFPNYSRTVGTRSMRVTEPVPSELDGGGTDFFARVFQIDIGFDDRLDEAAKLQLSRARRLLSSGLYLEAIPCLDDVIQVFPKNGDALFFRAQALARIGFTEQAREDIDHVLQRYPKDLEALALKADLASQSGLREAALDALQRAERLQPNSPYVLRTMARGWRRIGQTDRARQILNDLLDRNPRDAASCIEMAELVGTGALLESAGAEEQRDTELALKYARRALSEDPNNWVYGQTAAKILAAAGRFDEALMMQHKVVEVAPKWAWKDCVDKLESYRRHEYPEQETQTQQASSRAPVTRPAVRVQAQ